MPRWYELHKHYRDEDSIVERIPIGDGDAGIVDARAQLIARVAIAHVIEPAARYEAFIMTREKLDWIE